MIKFERDLSGRFSVVANNKILLSTKDFNYAMLAYKAAQNNDFDFALKSFIPASVSNLQGSKI